MKMQSVKFWSLLGIVVALVAVPAQAEYGSSRSPVRSFESSRSSSPSSTLDRDQLSGVSPEVANKIVEKEIAEKIDQLNRLSDANGRLEQSRAATERAFDQVDQVSSSGDQLVLDLNNQLRDQGDDFDRLASRANRTQVPQSFARQGLRPADSSECNEATRGSQQLTSILSSVSQMAQQSKDSLARSAREGKKDAEKNREEVAKLLKAQLLFENNPTDERRRAINNALEAEGITLRVGEEDSAGAADQIIAKAEALRETLDLEKEWAEFQGLDKEQKKFAETFIKMQSLLADSEDLDDEFTDEFIAETQNNLNNMIAQLSQAFLQSAIDASRTCRDIEDDVRGNNKGGSNITGGLAEKAIQKIRLTNSFKPEFLTANVVNPLQRAQFDAVQRSQNFFQELQAVESISNDLGNTDSCPDDAENQIQALVAQLANEANNVTSSGDPETILNNMMTFVTSVQNVDASATNILQPAVDSCDRYADIKDNLEGIIKKSQQESQQFAGQAGGVPGVGIPGPIGGGFGGGLPAHIQGGI